MMVKTRRCSRPGKVGCDQPAVGGSEVVDAVGAVLTDVNLPVGVGDLVDDHGRQSAEPVSNPRYLFRGP